MIRFIDINNGRTYNGDQPYTHWFDDQQSTDIIYVQKLCLLSDSPSITVFMPENDIFRLIDTSKITKDNLVNLDGVGYQDISKLYTNIIPGDDKTETIWVRTSNPAEAEVPYFGYGYSSTSNIKYHACVTSTKIPLKKGETFGIDVQDIRNIVGVTKMWLSTEKNNYNKSNSLKGNIYSYVEGLDFIYTSPEDTEVYLNIEGPVVGSDPTTEGLFCKGFDVKYNIQSADKTKYTFPVGVGAEYGNDLFVYMIYIAGSSSKAMECRESFFVQEHIYEENPDSSKMLEQPLVFADGDIHEFTIGADFYEQREELKTNIINNGVEILESIQKAIYTSNPHEESKDNILLNRKYKELIMNYMDILGNKGSYASLINSLNWFEYGDLTTIKEFWKHNEWDRTIYNDQEFKQTLCNQTEQMLVNYSKTTYMGIYCACQKIKESHQKESYPSSGYKNTLFNTSLDRSLDGDNQDPQGLINRTLQVGVGESFITVSEDQTSDMIGANFKKLASMYKNMDRFLGEEIPELENNIMKWSKTDMAIKMALLGNFFETYFMPIHTDLIHSTIEDVVFTNTLKAVHDGHMKREDYIIHDSIVNCNIKDNEVFQLKDIQVQANSDTPFANLFDVKDPSGHTIFGIDEICTTDDFADIPERFIPENTTIVITPLSDEARNAAEPIKPEAPIKPTVMNPPMPKKPTTIPYPTKPSGDITDEMTQEYLEAVAQYNIDLKNSLSQYNNLMNMYNEAILINNQKLEDYKNALKQYNIDLETYNIQVDKYNDYQRERKDYVYHASNHAQYYIDNQGTDVNVKSLLLSLFGEQQYDTQQAVIPQSWVETADRINNLVSEYFKTINPKAHKELISSYLYGLDFDTDSNKMLDPEIANILLNTYTGIGVVVPMVFTVPVNEGDNITSVSISRGIGAEDSWDWDRKVYNRIYPAIKTDTGYAATVILKLLCTRDCQYDIRAQFTCTSGQTYVKRVVYNVVDTRRASLNIYKVNAKTTDTTVSRESNDYMFTHTCITDLDDYQQYYTQYIPIRPEDSTEESSGARLTWMTVLRSNWKYNGNEYRLDNLIGIDLVDSDVFRNNFISHTGGTIAKLIYKYKGDLNFVAGTLWRTEEYKKMILRLLPKATRSDVYNRLYNATTTKAYAWLCRKCTKYHRADQKTKREYDIFIANAFNTRDTTGIVDQLSKYISDNWAKGSDEGKSLCLRSELIYIPQRHYLEELDRSTLMNMSVRPREALCVVPDVKYLRYIDSYEWDFINQSTGEHIQLPSVKEPFVGRVADNIEEDIYPYLYPGYYDVVFRYKLSSESDHVNEISLKSAFIQLPSIDDEQWKGSDLWVLAVNKYIDEYEDKIQKLENTSSIPSKTKQVLYEKLEEQINKYKELLKNQK